MGKKMVIKNSIIYILNNTLIKAFNFLLLPFYTAFLTTEDYGTINLIVSFVSVASYIVAFSLHAYVIRFYVDIKNDREQVKRFFGTMIVFVFLSGVIFLGIVSLLNSYFIAWIFKDINFYPTLLIALVGLVFSCVYSIYQDILKGMENATKYSITSICYFFIQLGFIIYFVVGLDWGANGVLMASLIANFVCFIYLLIDLFHNNLITICIDRKMLKNGLKYSIPLLPHNISTHITSFVSKIFINNSFSLTSVGLFSLATQFGSITDMIQSSVNIAFRPWFYDQLNKREKNYKKSITELSDILIWAYGIIFLLIALFSQEALLLFTNESYYRAWTVVPLIIIPFSIKTMYYFYINVLLYHKNATKFIFIATLSSSMINILLSAIFIPILDMYGSALADLIAMVIRVGIIVALSMHFEDIGYKLSTFVFLILINVFFISAGLIFSYTTFMYEISLINIAYKIFVVMIYLIIAGINLKKHIKPLILKLREKRS
ncbi:MAG: oligosaccharide flippase family protein [Acetobacterium sp.]|uniref:lipopolysaccharide biosynthesis protein n=1 Tax=Acetobacterium sp. TaxID=1872094 RepID=UPI003241EF49